MNTLNFPDANVWLALIHEDHVHSEAARAWFEGCAEEQFFFCRFTQITVLRLLTTPKVMAGGAVGMPEAWRLWDKVTEDDRIAFLDEPPGLEPEFRGFTRLMTPSPKVWADSYLVAFASAANLKLVTFDRAIKALSRDVVVIEATPI